MSASLVLLLVLLLLPVVLLFGFVGCTGEDPVLVAREAAAEQKAKDDVAAAGAAAKAAEDARYENQVRSDPNVVSVWRLDELETGDATAKDSAPINPFHGTYQFLQGIARGQAGALTSKDPNDKAAQFKGTQGFVEVPYNGLLNPPFSFSLELWLLPEGVSNAPQVVLGSYQLDPTGKVVRGFVLDVLRVPTLRIRARVGNGTDATALEASLGDGLTHGGWRHVVMTYDAAAKGLMLYVNADDGKADAQLPAPTLPSPVPFAVITAGELRIGAGQVEVASSGPGALPIGTVGQFFEGRLDEVAIYRVALPGSTIKNHFLAT